MTVRKNPCLLIALRELEAAGIRDVAIAHGSRHPQLRWATGRGRRVFTVAGSPSDWRAPRNTRADIRRVLRADGMIKPIEIAQDTDSQPTHPATGRAR
jgi:hypothetical protein